MTQGCCGETDRRQDSPGGTREGFPEEAQTWMIGSWPGVQVGAV